MKEEAITATNQRIPLALLRRIPQKVNVPEMISDIKIRVIRRGYAKLIIYLMLFSIFFATYQSPKRYPAHAKSVPAIRSAK